MPANEYQFVSRWRVEGTIEEVSDVLDDAPDLARWWPSVYLDVKQSVPGGPVELLTKGRQPYTLHWFFPVTESHRPHGFSIETWGDFEGRGTWTFEQTAGSRTSPTIGGYALRSRCCDMYRSCSSRYFRRIIAGRWRGGKNRSKRSSGGARARDNNRRGKRRDSADIAR
jgi:hypothetical protein